MLCSHIHNLLNSIGVKAMNKLFSSPLTDFQITCIMVALDKDKSGTLSYKEFLDGFKVHHTTRHTFKL